MKEKNLLNDSILSLVTSQLGSASGRSGDRALQLLQARDDHVFVWSRAGQTLLAVNTSPSESEKNPLQTLALTDCPLFDVEGLTISRTGKWVALFGRTGVTAVEVRSAGGLYGKS